MRKIIEEIFRKTQIRFGNSIRRGKPTAIYQLDPTSSVQKLSESIIQLLYFFDSQ